MRYFVLILVLLSNLVVAQTGDLKYERFGVSQGLSSNEVKNMIQDSDGYIWIATDEGIDKYNGFDFKSYSFNTEDSCSISEGEILGILEKGENIWMGATTGILNKYNKTTGCFTKYKLYNNDTLWNHAIWDITDAGDSMLWLATERGIVSFDMKKEHSSVYRPTQQNASSFQLTNDVIYNIHKDKKDPYNLLLGTRSGILIFNTRTLTFSKFFIFPYSYVIKDIYQEDDNLMWVAVEKRGIVKIDRGKKLYRIYKPDNYRKKNPTANFIRKIKNNKYWVGFFDYGLAIFNSKKNKFTFLEDIHTGILDYPINNCRSFLKTKDDTYCFGSIDGLYISKKKSRLFRHYLFDKKKVKRPIFYFSWDIFELGDTAYLVSNTYQQPFIIDKKTGESIDTISLSKAILRENSVRHFQKIVKDNKNRLWITSETGFYSIDLKRKKIKIPKLKTSIDISKHYVSEGINSIKYNALYFISDKKDIWKMDTDTDSLFLIKPGFRDKEVKYIRDLDFINEDELLFVGYPFSMKYNIAQNKFEKIGSKENEALLKHEWINCGIANGDEILFGYGRKGINIYNEDNKTITSLNKGTGLSSNRVYEMEKDKNGNIWVSTGRGLEVLSFEDYKTIDRFDQEDGLIKNDLGVYWVSSLKLLPSGEMFVGGHGFFTVFNPDSLLSSAYKINKIKFESLLVNGKEKRFDKILNRKTSISLLAKENTFRIKFANPDFNKKSHQKYKYRLSGYDDNWFYTSNNNIIFSKIPPGKYQLQLAFEKSGTIKNLGITIIPEWWQTVWFKVLFVLFNLGILFFLYSKRVAFIKEKARLKAKYDNDLLETEMKILQSQMNSHFLFNTLNSIKNYIIKNETRQAANYLNNFSILIRKILNNSEHKFISLNEELEIIKLYFGLEMLRHKDRFKYSIDIDKNIDIYNSKVPPLLLQPFVENAIWHGLLHKKDKGEINIEVKLIEDRLQYIITDNGIGRIQSEALKSKSALNKKNFGLRLSKERLETLKKIYDMNINFDIIDLYDDNKAVGTKVIVEFVKNIKLWKKN